MVFASPGTLSRAHGHRSAGRSPGSPAAGTADHLVNAPEIHRWRPTPTPARPAQGSAWVRAQRMCRTRHDGCRWTFSGTVDPGAGCGTPSGGATGGGGAPDPCSRDPPPWSPSITNQGPTNAQSRPTQAHRDLPRLDLLAAPLPYPTSLGVIRLTPMHVIVGTAGGHTACGLPPCGQFSPRRATGGPRPRVPTSMRSVDLGGRTR